MNSFLAVPGFSTIIQPMLKYSCDESHSSEMDDLVIYLKALAEPNRLRIFNVLMEGSHCNCELGEKLGLPANLISHHLAVLRQIGLITAVRDETDSRWIIYSVNRGALSQLNVALKTLLDPDRIQNRQPRCRLEDETKTSAGHPEITEAKT